ncbi:hypothetical protein PENVUL_c005G09875 [Penicillium vulpinum]|uniref:Uncharacterized protein n=2 Tax=Penicillium vulpinum TaxID=29845 RepID=A0A1V6S732_9EURO|nr:hypothetical protein PENVUL_c005G09875 [Penicillium vulpinum]
MASVATKSPTPVMPTSYSMSQDLSRAMTNSTQKTEKTRSILIDGMPPAPPPSPVAFSKGKACYNNISSFSLEEYDIEGLSSVVKKLLEAQVFESTLKAKIRFPELFDVSPAQSAERETSEAEAARDEANSIKEISEKEFTPSNAVDLLPETSRADKGKEKLDEYLAEHDRQPDREIPSLYPIYIPYRSQHLITSSVQSIVEESCFIFGQQHFPQLLARKQWDCPEAVELTEWTKILAQNHTLLNTTVVKAAKKPLDEIFGLLRELRHSVVHRLRRSASGVERLVENAELFVEVLQDQDRLGKISILRNELKTAIEELARNKDLLEASLLAQLKDIRAERAKLDLREQNAIQAMTDDDLQYLDDTGHRLVDMI